MYKFIHVDLDFAQMKPIFGRDIIVSLDSFLPQFPLWFLWYQILPRIRRPSLLSLAPRSSQAYLLRYDQFPLGYLFSEETFSARNGYFLHKNKDSRTKSEHRLQVYCQTEKPTPTEFRLRRMRL